MSNEIQPDIGRSLFANDGALGKKGEGIFCIVMGRCKKTSKKLNSVIRFLGIFFNSMLIKTDEGSEEGSEYPEESKYKVKHWDSVVEH